MSEKKEGTEITTSATLAWTPLLCDLLELCQVHARDLDSGELPRLALVADLIARQAVLGGGQLRRGPEGLLFQVGCLDISTQEVLEVPTRVLRVRLDLRERRVTQEPLTVCETHQGRRGTLRHLVLDDIHDAL
eukprot:CAMPEP_0171225006 /NCGR_PEP_ID=MMETSP0790-20130122/36583_1 /TAXON_ID=2925 /ORGANISM="Alexandrium catenella, Strain OF101" /LENGTH=132 /DNA_ID=CAMNT_0011691023 /DNA_START=1 /DNA_END=395 /DNA_ORIENTATION=-